MIGCAGPNKATKLAELIAGFCLALDLSTMSAIANGTFALAHEKLGRNRPVNWFTAEDINTEFIKKYAHFSPNQEVLAIGEVENNAKGSSIISELTSRRAKKFIGHKFIDVTLDSPNGQSKVELTLKAKPLDHEVVLMIQGGEYVRSQDCQSHFPL